VDPTSHKPLKSESATGTRPIRPSSPLVHFVVVPRLCLVRKFSHDLHIRRRVRTTRKQRDAMLHVKAPRNALVSSDSQKGPLCGPASRATRSVMMVSEQVSHAFTSRISVSPDLWISFLTQFIHFPTIASSEFLIKGISTDSFFHPCVTVWAEFLSLSFKGPSVIASPQR
jgi:hypothetical protein